MLTYILIPLLPLVAFVVIGLFWSFFRNQSHWIAVPAVFLSFILSMKTFFEVAGGKELNVNLYTWITSGHFQVSIGFQIDALTSVMLLLVTLVSGLVHLYTIGYMKGDDNNIPSDKNAHNTKDKNNRTQNQVVIKWNHSS